jgi:BirA family transcriptional regulator, biotin operon repressor / biotin---[acetyl-CoA-carboxylase] ligase
MFDSEDYNKRLNTRWIGTPLVYLEKTDSTNNWLKPLPKKSLSHGTVLLADDQSTGRGQKKRVWRSEPGKNLTFTIALCPQLQGRYDRLGLLSLMAGAGIVRALTRLYDKRFYLKWPNDIMLSGRKLGGILTEIVFNGSRLDRVLIGIGLNVNQTRFPDDLPDASSLSSELQMECCREEILTVLLEEVESCYIRWLKQDEQLVFEINRILSGVGSWVELSVNGKIEARELKFLGIDKFGHLNFMTSEFDIQKYSHEQIDILQHP